MAVSFFTVTSLSLSLRRREVIFSRFNPRDASVCRTGTGLAPRMPSTASTSFLPIRFSPWMSSSTESCSSFIISRATALIFRLPVCSATLSRVAGASFFSGEGVLAGASFFSGAASAGASSAGTSTEVSTEQATVPTATLSPSATMIFSFPEASATRVRVALSLSISAISCPCLTRAPSSASQRPISTSVIDSPGLGTFISVIIG